MTHYLKFTLALAAAAFAIETVCGYPSWLHRKIGHPVTWIGHLIAYLDRNLNRDDARSIQRRLLGFLAVGILLSLATFIAKAPSFMFLDMETLGSLEFWVVAAVTSTLLAQRSLFFHVRDVANALENEGIAAGRISVARIVGRNVQTLNTSGISRAAIESLAENFADGVVAPAFWIAIFGLPGGLLYKAINTADSMIGHRTPRFEAFGYAAARLDDLLNLIPARLAAFSLCFAATVTEDASGRDAWRIMLRDSRGHRSPNAGWPEAAAAGALAISLGGPRSYGTDAIEDTAIGDGDRDVSVNDINRALRLYRRACALTGLILSVLASIFIWLGNTS
jgi:adenosylcobinamide-phosphate synthase